MEAGARFIFNQILSLCYTHIDGRSSQVAIELTKIILIYNSATVKTANKQKELRSECRAMHVCRVVVGN